MLRFGTVPSSWNNHDVPEPAPLAGFEQVLDEIAEAGFAGTELGGNYPRDPGALKRALVRRGLVLSGAYYCPGLTERVGAAAALDEVDGFLDFLAEVGATALIVAEPVVKVRSAVAGRVDEAGGPVLNDEQWQTLADALNQLGARCASRGLALAFHNHAGTYVETPRELMRLMAMTDPRLVGLCLDTGHYTFGGGDAAEAVGRYMLRLRYLHLEDLDPKVFGDVKSQRLDFPTARRRGVFTELGTGCVDVAAIANKLMAEQWDGWVVAGQDTTHQAPLASAKANRAALAKLFGAAVGQA